MVSDWKQQPDNLRLIEALQRLCESECILSMYGDVMFRENKCTSFCLHKMEQHCMLAHRIIHVYISLKPFNAHDAINQTRRRGQHEGKNEQTESSRNSQNPKHVAWPSRSSLDPPMDRYGLINSRWDAALGLHLFCLKTRLHPAILIILSTAYCINACFLLTLRTMAAKNPKRKWSDRSSSCGLSRSACHQQFHGESTANTSDSASLLENCLREHSRHEIMICKCDVHAV
jgi:hypothetical protein